MNFVENAKAKVISFEAKHKLVPKSMAAVAALGTAAATAGMVSAEGNANSIDISSVTDAMTTSFTDLVGKVGTACAGVVAAGMSIFAIKWAVGKVMSFFKTIGGR